MKYCTESSYTLTPAYGRDYKSRAAVLADFDANKDFIDQSFDSPWSGKPVNKEQIEPGSTVKIRYNNLRREVTVAVSR